MKNQIQAYYAVVDVDDVLQDDLEVSKLPSYLKECEELSENRLEIRRNFFRLCVNRDYRKGG